MGLLGRLHLFGTFTLGPAFAWAHLHLSAKRGQDPFHVQKFGDHSSHPNDDARMKVICAALDLMGYNIEKEKILEKWTLLNAITPYEIDETFKMAYPDKLLEICAIHGLEAVKGIGCHVANRTNEKPIYLMLNQAWDKFWEDSEEYFDWETETLARIMA